MKISSLSSLLALIGNPLLSHAATTKKPEKTITSHDEVMQNYDDLTNGKKLNFVMLVYPDMFLQDLVGPLTVFESLFNREIHLVWKNLGPINKDQNASIQITPNHTFETCPEHCDVLFIPGGVQGTFDLMQDNEVLAFIKKQAASAKYISSVCTGSHILGAAGLLEGYKATSNWLTLDSLTEFGATPIQDRVVVDRNRITGAGVTAGLDLALVIVEKLRTRFNAQAIQLYLEYDPKPPFNAGSPKTAPKEVFTFLDTMFHSLKTNASRLAKQVSGQKK